MATPTLVFSSLLATLFALGLLVAPYPAVAVEARYHYDAAGRLTGEDLGEIHIRYRYDAAGNLLSQTACRGPCFIDGTCYQAGQADPERPCAVCDPSVDPQAWTLLGDGTACEDGDPCTEGEACASGLCGGGTPKGCPPPAACQEAGRCDAASGECVYAAKPDGTACPGGTCQGGDCVPVSGDGGASDAGEGGGDAAGCGCASGSAGAGPWSLFLAALLLLLCRRRRLRSGRQLFGRWTHLAGFFLLVAASAAPVEAATVCGDGSCDFTRVADALRDAPPGESILIKPGVYYESGLSVTRRVVQGENPEDPTSVVIDAEGNGFVFERAIESVFRGLTLRGGEAGSSQGGAIRAEGTTTIDRVIFENNHAASGGAIAVPTGTPLIVSHSIFRNNSAEATGGAISVVAPWVVIENCRFENNTAIGPTSAGVGGAIATAGEVHIVASDFLGNRAGGGGALSLGTGSLETRALVEASSFTGNDAVRNEGGAIRVATKVQLLLAGSTLDGNSAARGGGVAIAPSAGQTVRILGGAITQNTVPMVGDGGGIWCGGPGMLLEQTAVLSGNSPDQHAGCGGCVAGERQGCDTGRPGACAMGTQACTSDGLWGACTVMPPDRPPESACGNGEDDDCDGRTDAEDPDCTPPPPVTRGQSSGSSGEKGDPVDTFTGEFFRYEAPDLDLGGPLPIRFQRYYASGLDAAGRSGRLGAGWRHSFEWSLTVTGSDAYVLDPTGRQTHFESAGVQRWTRLEPQDIGLDLWGSVASGYELYDPRREERIHFDSGGRVVAISDLAGRRMDLSYNGSDLALVTGPLGRQLAFGYDAGGLLDSVSDGIRTVTFGHTGDLLVSVNFGAGETWSYEYDAGRRLTRLVRPDGTAALAQTYDGSGRVSTQRLGPDGVVTFGYDDTTWQRSFVDPEGRRVQHDYDALGRLLALTWEDDTTWTLRYDGYGRRVGVTFENGRTETFVKDEQSGALREWITASGLRIEAGLQTHFVGGLRVPRLGGMTFPDGSSERFEYDAEGRVRRYEDRTGASVALEHDASGHLVAVTNPLGGTARATYDAAGRVLSRTNAAGETTTFRYDSLGRVVATTHPDGSEEQWAYDARDRIVAYTDPRGQVTRYTYDANGDLVGIEDAEGYTATIAWDSAGRFVSFTDPRGATESVVYDVAGRAIRQIDRSGAITEVEYDVAGRPVAFVDPNGERWTYEYTADGRFAGIRDPLGQGSTLEYDAQGRPVALMDARGNRTERLFDAQDRLVGVVDAGGNTTEFIRNAVGEVTEIRAPEGIVSRYEYDAWGNLVSVTDPNGGLWAFEYDLDGRLVASTDPNGNTVRRTLDALGQPVAFELPGALGTITVGYDASGNISSQTYGDGTTVSFTYDGRDLRVAGTGLSLGRDENGAVRESNGLTMTRDGTGRLTSLTYGAGKTVRYRYDAAGNLLEVSDWLGNTVSFEHDAAGRRTTVTRSNGLSTAFDYDADRHLIGIEERRGATVLAATELTRDARGEIVSARRPDPPADPAPPADGSWSYDAASQVADFDYDALGRLLDDGIRSYTWAALGWLAGYSSGGDSVSFEYDGFGHRIARDDGAEREEYVWNYGTEIPSLAIIRRGGSDWRYLIFTPTGELLYEVEAATGHTFHHHFDERGNTLLLSDDGGEVVSRFAYTAYGEVLASAGTVETLLTYSGEHSVIEEAATGLYWMGRRVYDARTKRFLSREPVPNFSHPQSIDPYAYALTNPLHYLDWSGEESVGASSDVKGPGLTKAATIGTAAGLAVGERIAGEKAKQATRVLRRAERLAGFRRAGGQSIPSGIRRVLDNRDAFEKVARASEILDEVGKLGKAVSYGAAVKEKGIARATFDVAAGEAGTYVGGRIGARFRAGALGSKLGGSVVGIAIDAYDTNEKVKKVQNRLHTVQAANLATFMAQDAALWEAYRAKRLTREEFERLYYEAYQNFEAMRQGSFWAGVSEIGIEVANGAIDMLTKLFPF